MCSVNESGTPAGASGSSRASPLVLRASMACDAALDLAHVVEILVEALLVAGAELAAHVGHLGRRSSRGCCGATARRSARSSFELPEPNSMSKATRGSRIIGSGSFGEAQLIESV